MTRQRTCTECIGCGKLGPEAPFTPEAQELADAAGWLIIGNRRTTLRKEYCPECRGTLDLQHCSISKHQAGSVGVARYSLIVDQRKAYACGIHFTQLVRELFAGGADEIAVRPIGK